jgi:hypothetical protein
VPLPLDGFAVKYIVDCSANVVGFVRFVVFKVNPLSLYMDKPPEPSHNVLTLVAWLGNE